MSIRSARLAVVLVAPLVLGACATKGFVRREVAFERNARIAADSQLAAVDSQLAARITALRADLDSMRTEFRVNIAALEDGLRFAMPITFAFDDATVRAEARPMLERFAQVVDKYYPSSTITIEGFADPAGSERYNAELSQRRAENVRRTLESLGLNANPLRAYGYGEARLVVPGAQKDDAGAESNRRVVFVIENAGWEAAIALRPST